MTRRDHEIHLSGGVNAVICCSCGGYIDVLVSWLAGRCEECGVWSYLRNYVSDLWTANGVLGNG